MITKEDYTRAKEVDMYNLLNSYGIVHKGNKYCCPFHNEKTPSAVIGYSNRLHCFGQCNGVTYRNGKKNGNSYSTIDVVMHLENCDEFTAIRKLLGSSIEPVKKEGKGVSNCNGLKFDYNFGLNISRPLDKNNIGYIKDYLNKRCILNILNVADKLNIEIRHNYYKSKNYICYNFKDYNFIIQKALDKSSKKNFGSPVPTYFKINDSNEWYITEGIEDCFSLLLAHKYNVVCLNSVSNLDKFLDEVDKKNKYIIATDNDNSGNNTKDDIIRELRKLNIEVEPYTKFYEFAEKHKLKDINECFIYTKEMKKIDKTKN